MGLVLPICSVWREAAAFGIDKLSFNSIREVSVELAIAAMHLRNFTGHLRNPPRIVRNSGFSRGFGGADD